MRAAHARSSPRSRVNASTAPLGGTSVARGRLRWEAEMGQGSWGGSHGTALGRVWVAPGPAGCGRGGSSLWRGGSRALLGPCDDLSLSSDVCPAGRGRSVVSHIPWAAASSWEISPCPLPEPCASSLLPPGCPLSLRPGGCVAPGGVFNPFSVSCKAGALQRAWLPADNGPLPLWVQHPHSAAQAAPVG